MTVRPPVDFYPLEQSDLIVVITLTLETKEPGSVLTPNQDCVVVNVGKIVGMSMPTER